MTEASLETLTKIADRIKKLGLEAPVRLFLEMHRPLGNVFRESVVVCSPLLTLIFGTDAAKKFSALCAEAGAFDALMSQLKESHGA